jgi:hypothetical protein
MQTVKLRLDAWRDAEHRRDRLAPGSSEWQYADDQVRYAETAFHAELAQVTARYAEADFERLNTGWFGRVVRVVEGAAQ